MNKYLRLGSCFINIDIIKTITFDHSDVCPEKKIVWCYISTNEEIHVFEFKNIDEYNSFINRFENMICNNGYYLHVKYVEFINTSIKGKQLHE